MPVFGTILVPSSGISFGPRGPGKPTRGFHLGSSFWNHFGSSFRGRFFLPAGHEKLIARARKIGSRGSILVPIFGTILVPNSGTSFGSRGQGKLGPRGSVLVPIFGTILVPIFGGVFWPRY